LIGLIGIQVASARVGRVFSFPNPVNEVAARLVAAGVVVLSLAFLATGQTWLLALLAYGFVARVLAGPRFSPLARFVTQVLVPRLAIEPKPVPGPPKRFAQGVGGTLSVAALLAAVLGATTLAFVLVGLITVAATLESVFALCIGCKVFALLMRTGILPASACADCGDLSRRLRAATPSGVQAQHR
jgi:hypothetical protein